MSEPFGAKKYAIRKDAQYYTVGHLHSRWYYRFKFLIIPFIVCVFITDIATQYDHIFNFWMFCFGLSLIIFVNGAYATNVDPFSEIDSMDNIKKKLQFFFYAKIY